jgi:iron complex transport system substrate-binding protein
VASRSIEVVSLQPRNFSEMYSYWIQLGKLTGKREASIKMVNNFKMKINKINKIVSAEKPVKVFFESIHSKFYTFSKDSIANFVLTVAGGENIATDAPSIRHSNIAAYSKEKIINKGNEIDFYISQYGAMNHITIDKIVNEPGFKAIKAVKNNKIVIVPENIISRPTPELIKGIKLLIKYLHPDIYNKIKNI